jgi:uncharacterized protein with NRDE domain
MCLILIAYAARADLPLVVAANRDEFYRRPALAVHEWAENSQILAGRDLEADGTWLGVSTAGRFAAVTNQTDPTEDAPLSRGALTADFLRSDTTAAAFAANIDGPRYRGFNLLLWDGETLVYTSNRASTQVLKPGIYGLANAALGAEWPKVIRGRSGLARILSASTEPESLIRLLADDTVPPDHELPDRGRALEMERRIAPCFIRGDDYGTRASTAVIVSHSDVTIAEQLYDAGGTKGSRGQLRRMRT